MNIATVSTGTTSAQGPIVSRQGDQATVNVAPGLNVTGKLVRG